jgi:hypothetical protein
MTKDDVTRDTQDVPSTGKERPGEKGADGQPVRSLLTSDGRLRGQGLLRMKHGHGKEIDGSKDRRIA